jgi:phosphoribosylformylglycinamidine cyclo-ligase
MGHRLEIYIDEKFARPIMDIAAGFGVEAQKIGYCSLSEKKKLSIESEFGTFEYQ